MCGIVGIFAYDRVAEQLYESLINLQHRGQDAAGILTSGSGFAVVKDAGLVRDIFNKNDLSKMEGNIGIGHTRYPTAGGYGAKDVQPIWVDNPQGVALAHNGNLINHKSLYLEINQTQQNRFNSSMDSEVLLHMLADNLKPGVMNSNEFFNQLCDTVHYIFTKAVGSFSIVAVILGKGLLAFRDPHGIKPLVMGERLRADGKMDYILASETTMFYPLGFQSKGNLQAGELIYIDLEGNVFRKKLINKAFRPCVFEYVYFARPDSTLDNISVYQARMQMGKLLAQSWRKKYPDVLPDVVIPTPDTANTAALAFAEELGVRYCEGLYKNNFIGRTFIMADIKNRGQSVRHKLTPHGAEIKGKKVLILDDSIVRGTTSREIVKMLREHGASEVSFVSGCPPIMHPCFYGIDIPSRGELLAGQRTEQEICQFLNIDRLLYQSVDDLVKAVIGQSEIENVCMACMNGQYITGNMNESKMQYLENERHVATV